VLDDWAPRNTSCSAMSTAKGACKFAATWQCAGGKAVCTPALPGDEICDGQGGDEDCDGKSDEGFSLDTDANNCGSCGHQCSASQTCCGGSCVDTRSSNANCNGCGKACVTGQTCCSSSCKNTKADNGNCGSCGNVCGTLTGCTGGSCVLLSL
jgi:Stigma-specific protein, Stig1